MVEFLDGPAAGAALRLLRCPIVLRVVRSPSGQIDALNDPEDVARPRESIFVYRLSTKPTSCFIRCSPRSASGLYINAKYAHVAGVDGEQIKTNARMG